MRHIRMIRGVETEGQEVTSGPEVRHKCGNQNKTGNTGQETPGGNKKQLNLKMHQK